jgi:hypothetical protein
MFAKLELKKTITKNVKTMTTNSTHPTTAMKLAMKMMISVKLTTVLMGTLLCLSWSAQLIS